MIIKRLKSLKKKDKHLVTKNSKRHDTTKASRPRSPSVRALLLKFNSKTITNRGNLCHNHCREKTHQTCQN